MNIKPFPLDRRSPLERKLDGLPRWKQALISIPTWVVTIYIGLGLLRAFAALAFRHAPMYWPWLDWWWVWLFHP
jgi:hypothetical protein